MSVPPPPSSPGSRPASLPTVGGVAPKPVTKAAATADTKAIAPAIMRGSLQAKDVAELPRPAGAPRVVATIANAEREIEDAMAVCAEERALLRGRGAGIEILGVEGLALMRFSPGTALARLERKAGIWTLNRSK